MDGSVWQGAGFRDMDLHSLRIVWDRASRWRGESHLWLPPPPQRGEGGEAVASAVCWSIWPNNSFLLMHVHTAPINVSGGDTFTLRRLTFPPVLIGMSVFCYTVLFSQVKIFVSLLVCLSHYNLSSVVRLVSTVVKSLILRV